MGSFYVYAYLDPGKPGVYSYGGFCFTNEPFYVGKGCGARRYAHLRDATKPGRPKRHHAKIISIKKRLKMDPIIVTVQDGLSEKNAFKLEIDAISTIGRMEVGRGPLLNHSNGGEGTTGFSHPQSIEVRRRISQKLMGRKLSKEHAQRIGDGHRGKFVSEKSRKNLSESHMGIKMPPFTEEHKRRISESLKGRKYSDVARMNMSKGQKKRAPFSEETRRKLSEAHRGIPSWNKGIKTPKSIRKKISESMKLLRKKQREQRI